MGNPPSALSTQKFIEGVAECRWLTAAPCYSSHNVSPKLTEVFREAYRELRPRTDAPPLHIRFYPFVSINNTIRLRQGELYIRLSDLLEGAPETVLHSIAHILLAKLYRRPIDRAHSSRFRRYIASQDIAAKARLVRQMRGRKHIHSARGHHYHLEEIFDDLNRRFFHGLMGRPAAYLEPKSRPQQPRSLRSRPQRHRDQPRL